jgi:hypothetical protein
MVPANNVVGNITVNFCLLQKHRWDKNWAVVGGYGCHDQTCGVRTWDVGCALAILLGVEYEQYYIQKFLDITKKIIPISSCAEPNNPILCSNTPLKKRVFET